jgi:hypothetical protein
MRLRRLVPLVALAVSRPAAAESHKLLVLQSEGRADAATRAKIDAAILKLAFGSEPQAAAGELNFSDAATAVGCKPETSLCKDEVLAMLSVDEIVITTVTPKPGGLEVAVHRFAKGGATREATMVVATGTPPDKLDGIAPLFGARPTTERPTGEPPAPTSITQEPLPSPIETSAEPASSQLIESQNPQRHRLELAGMIGGATMVTLGLLLWSAANGVQNDIDKAPTNTRQDLLNLKDLESKGDGFAVVGNVLVATGVVVGGLGTTFFLLDRRAASATSARLTPTVFDHGAGVVLTLGGMP